MAVKDLVHQYEQAQSPTGHGSRASSHRSQERSQYSARNPVPREASERVVERGLEPRRARFLHHVPGPRRQPSTNQTETTASPVASTLVGAPSAASQKPPEPFLEAEGRSVLVHSQSTLVAPQFDNSVPTLPAESGELPLKHDYPPQSAWSDDCDDPPRSPHQKTTQRPHEPVPAPVIFARDALPLSLPNLDRYLSSLPAPVLGDGCDDSSPMFPPLDQLQKTGRSLDDLETNTTVAPVWRNRSTILGGTLNTLIGLLVRC